MRFLLSLIVLVAALALCPDAKSQQVDKLSLKQFITSQEFKAAGLEKLTPGEYRALEDWFNRHTLRIFRMAQGSTAGATTQGRGTTPRRRGRYSGCEDGHWVDSVSRDGRIVKLEDGSIWEVDAVDAIDSALWLPTTDIVVCSDKLINTDDNESVSARRIR